TSETVVEVHKKVRYLKNIKTAQKYTEVFKTIDKTQTLYRQNKLLVFENLDIETQFVKQYYGQGWRFRLSELASIFIWLGYLVSDFQEKTWKIQVILRLVSAFLFIILFIP